MCGANEEGPVMAITRILALAVASAWPIAASAAEVRPPAESRMDRAAQIAQAPPSVQEVEVTMNVYPTGRFSPDPLTVKKGIPVRLRVRALQREHLNQISIRPFVTNVTLEPPGKITIINFIPTQTGTFKIRNLGHDFESAVIVVE
jgi:hypothetical protein